MTITTDWDIRADVLDSYTSKKTGITFTNVVTRVHWRCTATDSATGEQASIYGIQRLRRPETMSSFINLDRLAGMDVSQRRAQVLAWAEAREPGFVAATEAAVTTQLQDLLAPPPETTAIIL
jgi:hypothetical protein